MNLNNEAHFSQSPLNVDVNRSTFDRSTNWKGSTNAGKLNCMFIDEILPGDTVDLKTTMLTRMTTPFYPVMDGAKLDQYFFFVPMQDVWEHTKEFFGENDSSAWTQETEYFIPTIDATQNRTVGDLAHQMGIPLDVSSANKDINALPFRAVRKIYNEFFRDQNTQAPKLINYGDTETDTTLFELLPTNRIHDYFGSCLPAPQKGDAVKIALSGYLPVIATNPLGMEFRSAHDEGGYSQIDPSQGPITFDSTIATQENSSVMLAGEVYSQSFYGILPSNLYADTSAGIGVDVEALRVALKTQSILEKMAVSGTRYCEYIKSMFGVTSPDARQHRAELLGYSSTYLNMSEVTQNSPMLKYDATEEIDTTPLGTVGAYSKTIDNKCSFEHSFTEHGYLIGLFTVRQNRSYSQGINKLFKRKAMTDIYVPALANIGEQPVYTYEIYAADEDDDKIFGYQEAWADYRYKPSINCGLLDPAVSGTIGKEWTYGDLYEETPTLSDTWMQNGDTAIGRTLAVEDEDQFIHDVWISLKHTRCMPVYSVPSISEHF